MYIKKSLSISLIMCIVLSLSIYAHPGKTDDDGGHYNKSTGDYHYHHGYPAHNHIHGECPYDFDDKTGENSGTSSNSYNNNNYQQDNASETTYHSTEKVEVENANGDLWNEITEEYHFHDGSSVGKNSSDGSSDYEYIPTPPYEPPSQNQNATADNDSFIESGSLILICLFLAALWAYHSLKGDDNTVTTVTTFNLIIHIILFIIAIYFSLLWGYSSGANDVSDSVIYSVIYIIYIFILAFFVFCASFDNFPEGILRIIATVLLCIIPFTSLTGYLSGVKFKNDNTVYILEYSGMSEKYRQYHKDDCKSRSSHSHKAMIEEAEEKGYTPCEKCFTNKN